MIRIEAIRAEEEYAGTRATFLARCGSARVPLQIDMGLGDAVWPPPRTCTAFLDGLMNFASDHFCFPEANYRFCGPDQIGA